MSATIRAPIQAEPDREAVVSRSPTAPRLPRSGSAALVSSAAALVLGGLSLGIYLLQGGRLPSVNPDVAFASPIAVELLLVPVAVGIAWLELGRFLALRSTPPGPARVRSHHG
jgi:hypothetical protein